MDQIKKPEKYKEYLSQVDPKLLNQWRDEQDRLKKLLIEEENLPFTINPNDKSKPLLKRVAGVDISTFKDDRTKAIAALVVMDYTSFEVIRN